MPMSYRIDVQRNLVLTTASGTLTDDDVLGAKAQLVRDPDFRPGMKELADIRAINRLAVTPDGVRAMVELDAQEAAVMKSHRMALVAPGDATFGTARMYQQLTGSTHGVGVFRSMDEARAWLGLAD